MSSKRHAKMMVLPNQEQNNLTHEDEPTELSPILTPLSDTTSFKSLSEISNLINPPRSLGYILLLTVIIGGLQLSWCTEFSEGTPFLLSLGISKHTLALVWIAGPLSGTLGQPIVGIFSDNCSADYGRRRPFIWGGCVATCIALLYLCYSVDIVEFLSGARGDEAKLKTIPFAAFGVYLLDFSISCIQAATRAFIIDNVSTSQQQIANAWAARMIGFFNIFGYCLSSIELTKYFPFLGNNQFKVLATIAALTLLASTTVSCLVIKERNPKSDIIIKAERKKQQELLKNLGINPNKITPFSLVQSLWKQTINSYKRLSPQVKLVNFIEFLAWVGYFPMLFYTTTYVGELYQREWFAERPDGYIISPDEKKLLLEESTRRGSLALLIHAITSLLIDLILPILIKPHDPVEDGVSARSFHSVTKLSIVRGNLSRAIQKLTVAKIWTYSHFVFIGCMISTFWIDTSFKAIFMFGVLGIPWGVALWAPFVLISEEISRIKEIKTKGAIDSYSLKHTSAVSLVDGSSQDHSSRLLALSSGVKSSFGSHQDLPAVTPRLLAKYERYSYEPGIILGIHNVAVASPQVFSSLMSSFLFALLSRGTELGQFDSSLGWVYRFGGFVTIGAWLLSFKVKTWDELMEEDRKEIEAEET